MKKWTSILTITALLGTTFLSVPEVDANAVPFSKQANLKIKNGHTLKTIRTAAVKTYSLELSRWGIYNDGTHALETTKGLNAAINWAHNNGFLVLKVPAGTYMISKGVENDANSRSVNLVSNLVLELDKNTVFQKETNGFEGYSVIYVGPGVDNATLKGGKLLGDRDTHDYSQKEGSWSAGTHEWGYGVNIAGGRNITIDGVTIQKFTGDGIAIGGSTIGGGGKYTQADFELGSLDTKGKPIVQAGKIRTEMRTFENIKDPRYRVVNMWLPEGLDAKEFDVFYYKKDGSFLSKDKGRIYSNYSVAPKDAYSFRVVFSAQSTKAEVQWMVIENAKGVVIKNNDIGYNRRQGITAGGENVQILNNKIHHTSGTAPQSGIDIEPGFFPAINHTIKGNTFLDNKIQIVLCYGENALIDGNYFEQTSAVHGPVGVSIAKAYRGSKLVNNNTFKGSGLVLFSDNSKANNNKFTNAGASLSGENQTFTNATFFNSTFSIGTAKNQSASNLHFTQNGEVGGDKSSLYIWEVPTTLKNVTINADQTGKRIPGIVQGYGNSKSVYENLTIVDKAQRGSLLVSGTYKNPVLNTGGLSINREGSYVLDHARITGDHSLLRIDKLYGEAPSVTIKNSTLTLNKEVGYGAALYVLGAKEFNMTDSFVYAKNNTTTHAPLIKFGPYGYPAPTNINAITFNHNVVEGKKMLDGKPIIGIDTLNAGSDAPSYKFTNNTLYNLQLKLTAKDINTNNKVLTK